MSKICIIRRGYYPEDSHVRRNAETLVKAGHEVDLICLKGADQRYYEHINGVSVYRLPLKSSRIGIIRYAIEYALFFLMALFMVTILHLKRSYTHLEADSMPDFLIFCGLIPKMTGTKLVLYMFESMPELWSQKKNLSFKSFLIRLLQYQERFSCRFAYKVISCHELAKESLVSRGIEANTITVILNVPDESIVNKSICGKSHLNDSRKTINIVQHGTITESYGIQVVLRALSKLKGKVLMHYHVYGKGEYLPHLERLADELNVNDMVTFHGFVSHERMIRILCKANVGIIPVLHEFGSPIKMFELISLGKPVIASDLQTFKQHFSSNAITYFSKGDPISLAEVLEEFVCLPKDQIRKQINNASKEYEPYRWQATKKNYLRIYD